MPEFTRVLSTTEIHNFRDYGNYPIVGGARLKARILYRSGEHANATDQDLRCVAQCGLVNMVDLRGLSERERAPSRTPAGAPIPVICADGETTHAPHLSAGSGAFDAATARRNMCGRYAEIPFRPALVELYRRYFRSLVLTGGPSLVCCTAGKDRTGILVALLHCALGVHRDDIFSDYMLTNVAGNVDARIAALRGDLQLRFGAAMSDDAIRVVTSVEASFLQSAFDAIVERCGDLTSYVEKILGVTHEDRQELVARLAS